jgi:hypothetical protein
VTEQTIPQFMRWTKPANVTEALERSLAHAQDEEKWVSGAWFETDLDEAETDPWSDEVDPESHDRLVKEISKMSCTDVKACSAGIIAIETLDGEALYHYLTHGSELGEDLLANDPIAWGAMKFLATGLRDAFGVTEGDNNLYTTDPVAQVVAINDSRTPTFTDRREHHAKIVKGFERAVELSREADAQEPQHS